MSSDKRAKLGPIELEVIHGTIRAAELEIEAAVERTARSPMIRDQHDYRVALFDAKGRKLTGRSYSAIVEPVFEYFGEDNIFPGDVFFWNDPYNSCGAIGHVPDLCTTVPIFHGDRLIGFFDYRKAEIVSQHTRTDGMCSFWRTEVLRLPTGQFALLDTHFCDGEMYYGDAELITKEAAIEWLTKRAIRPPSDLFEEMGLVDFGKPDTSPNETSKHKKPKDNAPSSELQHAIIDVLKRARRPMDHTEVFQEAKVIAGWKLSTVQKALTYLASRGLVRPTSRGYKLPGEGQMHVRGWKTMEDDGRR